METPRGAEFSSLLWTKLITGHTQHRVDDVPREFPGDGWKDLPRELVDAILGHLWGDLEALKACSLTCKCLFGVARPLIHYRVCLASRSEPTAHPKPKGSLSSFRRRGHEAFERLVDADRWGLLHYIRHLTLKMEDGSFNPGNVREYLPNLRSITNLRSLTLDTFDAHPFIPVFDECFGTFTNTVRHLDIRNVYGTDQQLLCIISQFPLLEDLSIISPVEIAVHPGRPTPTVAQSPPLRGTLILAHALYSRELLGGLAAFPGGLNFRSLKLYRCRDSPVVLAACSHTVTSISYLWCLWHNDNTTPLDLERSVLLERFDFNVELYCFSQVHDWVHRTLRTITSSLFNEFGISILNTMHASLRRPVNADDWTAVDTSLDALAERNTDFRVVVRADFSSFCYNVNDNDGAIRGFIGSYLPLVSSKGLVKFEHVPHVENRFWTRLIL